ncbi:HU family DNA-binding protein [uncultured Prevotella sp.]|uniref:HU family DNA-binding protein n=1 Tax=uncultured Prevotella sp. TaxID=159272 RepID=UPI0027E3365B|nr:HU family DNA-binding protein [uncultured Prevotella sp.]
MAKVTDFAEELSKRYEIKPEEASDFIGLMFEVLMDELDAPDKQVKIKGLGTFKVTSVGARASVDVNTGERIILEGRNKISFTPEVLLRDRVNRPFVQFETVVLNDGVDFSDIDREFEENSKQVVEEDAKDEAIEENGDEDTEEETLEPDSVESETEESETTVEPETVDRETEEPETTVEPETVDQKTEEPETTVEPETVDQETEDSEPVEPETVDSDVLEADTDNSELNTGNSQLETGNSKQETDNSELKTDEPALESLVSVGCKQRNPRLMYWLSTASFVLLVCIGIGMYFLYRQIEEKNRAIEQLQSRLTVHAATVKDADDKPKDTVQKKQSEEQLASAETKETKVLPNEKAVAAGKAEFSVKPELSDKAGSASKPAVSVKDKSADKKTPASYSSRPTVTAPSDYNYDVRIRTGAYIIVGTDRVVTVKSGQTLASISKANLGPGMECYVEVYNNRKQVKAGDKIKIPKLKLKKLR